MCLFFAFAEEPERSLLEPSISQEPSLMEASSRQSISMVADDSSLRPHGTSLPQDSSMVAETSLRPEEPAPLPEAEEPALPATDMMPPRRDSSDYDNDDADDIFNNDLPSLPDETGDGSSAGGVSDFLMIFNVLKAKPTLQIFVLSILFL